MPATTVTVRTEDNQICRVKEDGGNKEPVSNFGISVVASVDVSSDAGGPGLLISIKRYPDNAEKVVFCPMSEVSGTVKQFLIAVNQQFPGGALFLLLSDHEFRKLMMEMTNKMMEDDQGRQLYAARLIGRNCVSQSTFWVMSEEVQVKSDGQLAQPEDTPFMWLRRLVNGNNILLQESLACKIATPFDNGQSIPHLCLAIQRFMPENFLPAMAAISACIMGANYMTILSMFGCCGVPMLTGAPGSCKSEAAKCALSMFGAHETHSCNNQTTPSYLFNAASKTTIPICVDDVGEKAADSWEELIIDAYNGSGRGTRMYGIEVFRTLPILSANWKIGMDRPRAHSRVIQIAFQQHEDEPEANLLFAEMANCRDNVSRSLGELIRLSQRFEQPETKEHINHFICPPVARLLSQFGAPARFTTTMSIFMYFFLEFSKLVADVRCLPSGESQPLFTEEDCWSFFADNMAPFTASGASVVPSLADQAGSTSQDLNGTDLVQSFVEMLSRAIQDLDTYQALQIASVDISTACHLGICIAVRVTEAVPLINAMPEVGFSKFSIHALETAFRLSGLGKRSKQRFLKASSKDDLIKHSRKGTGGNTIPYKCFILKQSAFPEETIELLRKGLAKKEKNPLIAELPLGSTAEQGTDSNLPGADNVVNGADLDHSPLTARDGGNDFGFGSQSSTDTVQPPTITLSTPPDADDHGSNEPEGAEACTSGFQETSLHLRNPQEKGNEAEGTEHDHEVMADDVNDLETTLPNAKKRKL